MSDPTPNTQHPTPLRPGFTLIELLVVLIGLVILASAVVPALRGAGHQQDLTEAAARVVASARFARDEAVARQEMIVLSVETTPPAVRLSVDTQGMVGAAASGIASSSSRPSTLVLPSVFALVRLPTGFQARLEAAPETFNGSVAPASGGSLQTLRFPPDGRTTGGMVVLTDARGRTLRVAVTPDTGVVQVGAING